MQTQKEAHRSGLKCLARLYWMLFGNALLLFLFVLIFEKRQATPTLLDAAFLLTGVSLIFIRFIDIRFLNGQTSEGQPATLTHWRGYAMNVGVLGLGLWLLDRMLILLLK